MCDMVSYGNTTRKFSLKNKLRHINISCLRNTRCINVNIFKILRMFTRSNVVDAYDMTVLRNINIYANLRIVSCKKLVSLLNLCRKASCNLNKVNIGVKTSVTILGKNLLTALDIDIDISSGSTSGNIDGFVGVGDCDSRGFVLEFAQRCVDGVSGLNVTGSGSILRITTELKVLDIRLGFSNFTIFLSNCRNNLASYDVSGLIHSLDSGERAVELSNGRA